jgi:hypothetical protein
VGLKFNKTSPIGSPKKQLMLVEKVATRHSDKGKIYIYMFLQLLKIFRPTSFRFSIVPRGEKMGFAQKINCRAV